MATTYDFDVSISSAVARTDGRETAAVGPLAPALLDRMQRYWAAANYLTIAQIYLRDNPLLREPLRPEQIKPRLLGHWGTSPGLNFVWAHLSRLISVQGTEMMIVISVCRAAMSLDRWAQMKFRPGEVPQCPSSRGLMCSGRSGSASSGLAIR